MTQDFSDSTNQPTLDPLLGQVFGGKYKITEKLGSGGMGGVYKAEQDLMGRFVAIKVLRSTFHGDEVQNRRFQQEAKTLSQLSHPNAVTVFDFGIENGLPYLVMEYIEGNTLKALIREERRVPLTRVKGILRQCCAALSEAHRLGIVHRDIKPDNIMLRPHHDGSDWVKVLDFGVAKSVIGNDPSLTQAGVLVGTPQYMSPEQCKGSELDPRADIYSLGVVLYEMLSGEVPFRAPSVLELLMKVMNAEPDSLRKFKTVLTLPASVDAIVLKALAKEPKDRFQTMADFYSSFEKSLPGTLAPKNQAAEKLSKKFMLGLGASAVVFGVGIYFGAHKISESRREHENRKHEQALEAERKKSEEESARLKAEAAVREAQAWQLEQEKLKLEEEQKVERERREAKQKEDQERSKAIERELALVKQRQAEMEVKVRDAERAKLDQEAERRLQEERKKLADQAAQKQRELEQKLAQAQKAKEDAERLAQQRKARDLPNTPTVQATPAARPTNRSEPVTTTAPAENAEDDVKKAPRRRCGPTWCD